ncbi:hypothetical protein [Polyangium sorediatum]|uniref:hypothetical protein n=1 Tax=Polyangium sorediatum TaxID=889274 RepID=UPI0010BDC7E8|nr:hypothetical protein [Polyangium sorediatum]
MRMRTCVVSWMGVVALAAAMGCGGTVKDVDATSAGPGGVGGAGGGGSGGAGAGGSGGGDGPVCDFFLPVGAPVVLDPPLDQSALSPKLVRSGLDPKTAVLAFMGVPVNGPAGALNDIHLRFLLDPWSTWPPVEGSNHVLADAQGPFVVSEGAAMEVALLRDTGTGPMPYTVVPAQLMIPKSANLPPDATHAGLLRMHPGGHILGYGRPHAGNTIELLVGFGRYSGKLPSVEGFTPVGCTKDEVLMDAVPTEKGMLVAFASNDDPASASGCTGSLSNAKQVVVARVTDGSPVGITLAGSTPDGPSVIQGLGMAGRNDGAWLAWGRAGWIETTATLQAQRLDAAGAFVGEPFFLAGSSDLNPATLGVGRLNNDLVVAWATGAQTSTRIEVRRLSTWSAGNPEATIEEKLSVSQPIAVLGSPTADAVLVAYSVVSEVDQTSRIHLQRFDCGVDL